ncbi:TM0106 family RecB-like putative nuclease [Vineibacter terrae]|uniref:TM0106 family RecB-like putative nuclease n=2 Tax=Vineibacter terrae TaxID=2586908 RepID=A0A5C8PDN6_9HYPH|nr:TM0106 family RecB-like putative nuclease [Vineibacter terrae]
MRFQSCAHATALDLRYARGDDLMMPAADDAAAELVQAKGDAHEAAYKARLEKAGPVVTITKDGLTLQDATAATVEALNEGAPHIYQAAFSDGQWGGYADFLERVERPSRLGTYSYEVVDTKLKRSADPKHLLQLSLYADLLAGIQGVAPEHVHVELGSGERASLRLADYAAYCRSLRHRLEAFVASPAETRPEPSAACSLCRWRDHCQEEWDRTDSLSLVAGSTRSQRQKLEAAGVTTIASLAKRKARVPTLVAETLERLTVQARLQQARRQGGPPSFELRATELGRGLARLPQPNPGDLFFDMEGDPYFEGGLEYLFGIYRADESEPAFTPIWAHNREEEARATVKVLALLDRHMQAHPGAHIYHYNHYEVTALKRLASLYAVGEAALDRLLRGKRFVDLYRVVQQGLIASEPGYSLKDLEVFYLPARGGDVATAADSVVAYEKYRETGDSSILEEIRAYNETDCRSTKGLRDWLVENVRPAGRPWFRPAAIGTEEPDVDTEADPHEIARRKLWERLKHDASGLGTKPLELLFELTAFHRREDKPAWWAMFDRAERESEELTDDLDSLGGLEAAGASWPVAHSQVRRYRFPEQETKVTAGDTVRVRSERLSRIKAEVLDLEQRTIDLKFGPSAGSPPQALDIIPDGPINNAVLRDAVWRVAADIATGGHRYPAIEGLLKREPPRIQGRRAGESVIDTAMDVVSAVVSAVRDAGSTCLPVQGPPGTGKTYVSSRAILALLREGQRVAVTSNSHKAIDNLLRAVASAAREERYPLKAVKKVNKGDAGPGDDLIKVVHDNKAPELQEYPLVAGTAWLFAREEHDQRFDYLFVDEAGQVSLANIVATGTCAKNIVLVGDPMQLAQPIRGVHPGDSGLSALQYVLHGHATVPPDKGIFLPVTHRMHPSICRYVSQIVYDGRLASEPDTARQQIIWGSKPYKGLPTAGTAFIDVEHDGNSQSSVEEARAVAGAVSALMGKRFRDRDGKKRVIGLDDILIVAPYNAHVNRLKEHLPAGARVGTIDKFQGQEAPVCLISMATSSGDELPRNIDFLFSTNRLNVAISRAQALAVVFASPRLLDVPCSTIEQMKLVNALCCLRELGTAELRRGR